MLDLMRAETPMDREAFKSVVGRVQEQATFRKPLLYAIGSPVMTKGKEPVLASVRYPVVNGPDQNLGTLAVLYGVLGLEEVSGVVNVPLTSGHVEHALRMFTSYAGEWDAHQNIRALRLAQQAVWNGQKIVFTAIYDDVDPVGVEDATLKLYGLSTRHFRPNQLNVTKIFTKLPNVAWIGDTPMDASEVDDALMNTAFGEGKFSPQMVDKFPLYIHRINALRMGVRITDQNKVRLGAYLGEGTTLMPGASYVNFNAGTDGGMIEGRISSSAMVGKGSDIGGGASMLGTLSGGNSTPISVGRNCLLEVNSVLGVPVGDAVIIAAECAVLASTNVKVLLDGHTKFGQVVKAGSLAGIHGVTFRRDDQTGEMQMLRTSRNVLFATKLENGQDILNADLHKN